MRRSFTLRRSWYRGEEVDAKVDFFAVAPEPEPTFESINTQLSANSSWIRRLRSPRFRRMQTLLAREQSGQGEASVRSEAAENDLGWLEEMGLPVPPVLVQKRRPSRSRLREIPLEIREFWWRHSPTSAAVWVREFWQRLPAPMAGPGSLRQRIEMLQAGLGAATAEDLRRATRRLILPISEVALFFDGYHRVERRDRPTFVIDFFERIAESKARVLLVVACRRQTQWSELADEQPDCEWFGPMTISNLVQIHRLESLGWSDSVHALWKYGVPADLVHELTQLSAGMPVALSLLGRAFGTTGDDSRDRALLNRLPLKTEPREEWFDQFSQILVAEMLQGLRPNLDLHLRAAATQRNFDRNLLAHLLGDDFSNRSFRQLIDSEFVGTARPSSVLRTEESYRVRSFVRDILAAAPSQGDVNKWRRLSVEYLTGQAERTPDPELEFQFEAEVLYHRLFMEPDVAKPELIQLFHAQLHASRTDHCEALLWIGLRFNWADPEWQATVLTHAGTMYLARNQNKLALERLLEAKATAQLNGSSSPLAVTISLVLARCYRLEERSLEARKELAWLGQRGDLHPVVRFQCLWSECREERDHGELIASRELTNEARELLSELLDDTRREESTATAKLHALGPLPRKRAHIVRHEADLARRGGDYVTSLAKMTEALEGYKTDPEMGIERYTELVGAHVRRQEGAFDTSIEAAFHIYNGFMEQKPRDLRGAGWAMRCLAQAQLQAADPEAAAPTLEKLTTIDPLVYPRARPFGLLGQAIIQRRLGNYPEARQLLRLSERAVKGGLSISSVSMCSSSGSRSTASNPATRPPGRSATFSSSLWLPSIRRLSSQPRCWEYACLAASATMFRPPNALLAESNVNLAREAGSSTPCRRRSRR